MTDNLDTTPWWWRTANGLALWARDAREQQGLSLEVLAARTGLAPSTIEALEGGRVWHVHVGVLIRVADALGYRLDLVRRGGNDDEA
jgi:transcriptional regulator with XRE-family HTH domain